MLTESTVPFVPGFPSPDILARFFRMDRDRPVPFDVVIELLGMTRRQATLLFEHEGGLVSGGVAWDDVAHALFCFWPRAELLDLLGPWKPRRVPALFYPTALTIKLPLYVQLAMELQATAAWEADPRVRARTFLRPVVRRGISDYIADILHEHIDEKTERTMRGTRAFSRAFLFPHERSDPE
jgi:hypothetical protein